MRSSGEKKAWQAGTILDVMAHEPADETGSESKSFEISIKAGKKIYVALCNCPSNQPEPEFYVREAHTVLIGSNTLKFNDLQGRAHSLRILSSKDAPSDNN